MLDWINIASLIQIAMFTRLILITKVLKHLLETAAYYYIRVFGSEFHYVEQCSDYHQALA